MRRLSRQNHQRTPQECLVVVDDYLTELKRVPIRRRTRNQHREVREWFAVRRLILAEIEAQN